MLIGRGPQRAAIDQVLAGAREGRSAALAFSGPPGIGKTTLLEYAAEQAVGMQVLGARGVESEARIPFAALLQLVRPVLGLLNRLAEPQIAAIEQAFALRPGPSRDRFAIGAATLGLLAAAAEEQPLLMLLDDVQWFDVPSSEALRFALRRLQADPLAAIVAVRAQHASLLDDSGITTLTLEGLSESEARKLRPDVSDAAWLNEVTGGNPLALLELLPETSDLQLAPEGAPVLLSERISAAYLRRATGLDQNARTCLLLAATSGDGDLRLLSHAADALDVEIDALAAAQDAGLIKIGGGRVEFQHPLVRSAVYSDATLGARRAVHRALATVLPDQALDRRAWHLAAAAVGPDEQVAVALERSAGGAQARGGRSAAAAFLERAVALTSDPARRVDRALAAAEANLQAGEFEAAGSLVTTAEAGPLDECQRARVELLRGQIALFSTLGRDAPPLLLKAAQHLERVDAGLARDTYLDAWGAALLAGRLATQAGLLEVSRAARSAPRPDGPPRPSDLLLDSLATLITDGRAAAARLLEEATRTFAEDHRTTDANLRWGWLTVVPTYALWDEKGTYAICVKQMRAVRDAGAVALLALELATFDLLAVRCGDFSRAEEAIAEADALGKATGSGMAPVSAMRLAAFRGREEARALIESVRDAASAAGQGVAVELTEWLLALLCNGLGYYEEALAAAACASEDRPGEVFVSSWTAMELLEAATRSHNPKLAAIAHKRIVAATAFSGTDSAQGILARSHALVSEGEIAERWYRDAIERLRRTLLRPELARAHLLYGEWLRREGRRVDAREQLRTAYDQLTSIGMEAFAERARRELVATGETARKRVDETRDELTAQEALIARLARDGLSNPEIGTRLFISPRTVKYHLRKVFIKLDITTRSQLATVLPSDHTIGQPL